MKRKLLTLFAAAALCVGSLAVGVSAAGNNTDVNDVAALKEAVADAQPGDTITLQKEIVLTETITVNQAITITAADGVVVKTSGSNTLFALSNNAVLDGVSIEKTDKTTQNSLVTMQAGTKVLNCVFTGLYKDGDSEVVRGIVTYGGATNIEISKNVFTALRQPAYIEGGSTGTVANNEVTGTRGWVICGDSDMAFTGNTSVDNAVDFAVINNNNNVNNYAGETTAISKANGGAYVENQVAGISAEDGQFFVQAGNTRADLAATLKEAQDGETIVVRDGVETEGNVACYEGNYSIGKSLTLTAAEGAAPVFTGMVSTSGADVKLQGLTFTTDNIAIYPSAGSLTVEGCTFGTEGGETFSAVYNESAMENLTFMKNVLNGSFRKGLLLHTAGKAIITDNVFNGGGEIYGEEDKTSVITIVATEKTSVTFKDNEIRDYYKVISVDNSTAQGTWDIKENKFVDVGYALEMSSENEFTYDISGNYFEQEGEAVAPIVLDAATDEAYTGEAVVTGPYYEDGDMEKLSDKVYGVELDKVTLALEPNESATLTVTIDAGIDADKTVTWTSSDSKVATVVDGKVTAVAAGKATITATVGGVSATCEVTVTAAPTTTTEPDDDTTGTTTDDTASDPDTGVAFPAAVLVLAAGAATALVLSKKRK